MERKIFIVLVFLSVSCGAFAQIDFVNPGFEGVPMANSSPPSWITCDYSPDTQPLSCCNWYIPAFQGNTYVGLGCGNKTDSIRESVGQKLSCNLVKGKMHHFSLSAYHISYVLWQSGQIEFWAGSKLCSKEKLLWHGAVVDTFWTKLNASFIPDSNYDYILFTGSACDTCEQVYIGLDSLSEITVDNYNLLNVPFSDTTINKWSCIKLTANSDDTTGRFAWSSIPSGFSASGSLVYVCPMQNTKYVCTITFGCGMQKSDTVNVEVTPSGVKNIQGEAYLSIYPNPAQDVLTIDVSNNIIPQQIIVMDALGRTVLSLMPHKSVTQIDVHSLSAGIYFIKTRLGNAGVRVDKFVKE